MSTVEEGEDPSFSSSGVILTEEPEKKEEGIAVPPTPKFNVFTGMLLFSFLGIGLACFLMYRELETYNFEKEVPAGVVKPLPPPEADPAPTARASGTRGAGS